MSTIKSTANRSEVDSELGGENGRLSAMAHRLIGSEILRIAAEIRALVESGKLICNLTVGDFSPAEFRIPAFLEQEIVNALKLGETNYPPSDGVMALKQSVVRFYQRLLHLDFSPDSILISSGSRPAIYATYRTLVDSGDSVVYPVPSWNNNHYCHLAGANGIPVVCDEHTNFLPTRKLLEKPIRGARLLALNSPLNPTGTAFDEGVLADICELVWEENLRRGSGERPLYLLYDQVYWMLTFGETRHYNPITLKPELRPYTILIDGISKSFAATGLRVGWTAAPPDLIDRMASFLGHVGAWAPKPEQTAVAKLLDAYEEITLYHSSMKRGLQDRLDALYAGISSLHVKGYPVTAITPMGAIYLSAQLRLSGKVTPAGKTLSTNETIREYLLQEAGLAIIPFQAFGSKAEDGWFRLSVGAVSVDAITRMFPRLESALSQLK